MRLLIKPGFAEASIRWVYDDAGTLCGVAGRAEEILLAMPMLQKERELVQDYVEKQKDMQLWMARVAKSGGNFLVGTRQEAIDIAANWSEEDE